VLRGAEAYIVVAPGSAEERLVPIVDRLFVGRECLGVDEAHRLLVDDLTVSRQHFEIRLEHEHDRAVVVDHSTNGTRLNGIRMAKGSPAPLRPGDRLSLGEVELEFRSDRFAGTNLADEGRTIRNVSLAKLVMVVGDIHNYSTISQYTDSKTMLDALEILYAGLGGILQRYKGTLSDYAGDAMFAVWELDRLDDAPELAINFALEAVDGVRQLGPMLPIRAPDGEPIKMGWGIVVGDAAVSSLTGALISVVGDATNLAFRLSGLAGRGGRPSVLVTHALREAVPDRFAWGEPDDVEVKGRTGTETVYGVLPAG
jgi:class 3 adenylate cyclase